MHKSKLQQLMTTNTALLKVLKRVLHRKEQDNETIEHVKEWISQEKGSKCELGANAILKVKQNGTKIYTPLYNSYGMYTDLILQLKDIEWNIECKSQDPTVACLQETCLMWRDSQNERMENVMCISYKWKPKARSNSSSHICQKTSNHHVPEITRKINVLVKQIFQQEA